MNYVLDACALIAYLRKEDGGDVVRDILLDSKKKCFIHALNLCEVYYDFARVASAEIADEMTQVTIEIGIQIIHDLDEDLWKNAGILKATIKRISLADTFAVSLAQRLNAFLVTSDHAEFNKVAKEKICKVLFIR
ncbi:MAG: type II toxin-antitoxin system VapC family toxin [Candidatus Kapaibacterium sp.]